MTLQNAPIAKAQMLIRKPVDEVFEAFVDPATTTKLIRPNARAGRARRGAR